MGNLCQEVMSDLSCPMCRDVPSQSKQSGLAGRPIHRLCQHQVNDLTRWPLFWETTDQKLSSYLLRRNNLPYFFSYCVSVDLKGPWGLQTPSATALGGSLQPLDHQHLSDIPYPPLSALPLNQHPHPVACRGKNCVILKDPWMSNLCYGRLLLIDLFFQWPHN